MNPIRRGNRRAPAFVLTLLPCAALLPLQALAETI